MGNARIPSIQALRAIASWMVVYHHYMQMFSHYQAKNLVGYFFSRYGAFGVDIFFVVSGFVMYYTLHDREQSAREYFTKRLLRIVPAYWFYTFILIGLSSAYATEFSFTSWNTVSLLKSLLFIPHDNPSGLGVLPFLTVGWSLNYEMFFYAILALCICTFGRWKFAATILALTVLPIVCAESWPGSPVLSSPRLVEFSAGVMIGYVYVRNRFFPKGNNTAGLTLLVVSVMLLFTPIGKASRFLSACCLVTSALCFSQGGTENRMSKMMGHLGDISYSVYLSHTLVLGVMLHYCGNRFGFAIEIRLLCMLTAAVYLMSYGSYRLVETGPLINQMRPVIYRVFAVAARPAVGPALRA
jgi:exopolysaccharide production protein ExoZ